MLSQCLARILPLLAAAGWLVAPPVDAIAADASAWDNDARSAARLIAAPARSDGTGRVLRAGLEIKLQPGWKTYWRYPGDSGVPPVFDFSASDNVKAVTVLYPAPMRFDDGAGGQSIGYKGEVILPLHVQPQEAGKPVTLRLKLDYAACEKLCVPAKAELALAIDDGKPAQPRAQAGAQVGTQDSAIAAAEARVPRSAVVGAPDALSIRAVRREDGAGKPRVLVDLVAPSAAPVTLFAEGPAADWALPLPAPVEGAAPPLQRFAFELDGLPPGAKAEGATLRLTAVSGGQAIEVEYRLD